jgi:hypothetical protein
MHRTMRLAVRWLPVLASLSLAASLSGGLDSGACNENHVCEPSESYEVCPQDCYWHPDGAEVLGKVVPARRADVGPCPAWPPPRRALRAPSATACASSARAGASAPTAPPPAATARTTPTSAPPASPTPRSPARRTECNSNGLCEFQDDPVLARRPVRRPRRAPPWRRRYNCPLDCTPMGPDPIAPHLHRHRRSATSSATPTRTTSTGPDECAPGLPRRLLRPR